MSSANHRAGVAILISAAALALGGVLVLTGVIPLEPQTRPMVGSILLVVAGIDASMAVWRFTRR
jgi:hypothetical protein